MTLRRSDTIKDNIATPKNCFLFFFILSTRDDETMKNNEKII